jgi:DNA-binding NarL/FixJ family response regulator
MHHPAQFNGRELQIIGMIGAGLSYTQIGRRLRVGMAVVRRHVRDILEKLGFRTRLEIAGYARRNGGRGH